jgi:hypothetical protein
MQITLHPHAATYELMGPVQGKACRNMDELGKMYKWAGSPSTDSNWIGSRFLYEEAKYNALETAHADNLMFVRAHAEITSNDVCVYITGRAYRILSLKAPPPLGDSAEAPHP